MALITETGGVVSFCTQHLNSSNTSYIANQWLQALQNGTLYILNELSVSKKNVEIAGLCISGNGPTLVSKNGRTLLWNASIPEETAIEISGSKSIFIPRLAAFKKMFPDEWNASEYIFSGPEFLIHVLTKNAVTILPEERYKDAYWTAESLSEYGIESKKLPEFVPPAFNAGLITPEYTKRLGLSKTIPVFCGGPDFIAALVGTNTLSAGKICDRAGSSEGINFCVDSPIHSDGLRTLPSVINGLWNISVIIPQSGSLLDTFRAEISALEGREYSYEEITDYAFNDKNSEGWRVISEVRGKVSEGIELIRKTARENSLTISDKMTLTGGQAKNSRWIQEKADGTDIKIAVTAIPDAELIGDAALAFFGLKKYRTIQEAAAALVKERTVFIPRKKNSSAAKIYKIPKNLKTIIFDIDSTLYTSAAYAFEQVDSQIRFWAKKQGITASAARNKISQFRKKWSAEHGGKKISLGNAFTHFGVTIEESVEMRRSLLEPADFLSKDERLISVLEELSKDYRLICVTNNPVLPARKTLEAIGISDLIPEIVGLDTCGKSKPAQEPFEKALSLTNSRPEECLAVGDRYDMDIALPLEMGMGGILVSGVCDVYELPKVLKNKPA